MARLRYNGLSATLGGSLTNSGTTITFTAGLTHSNGTNVPTISGSDYIPLEILDSSGHLSEIVWLTAYTAAATTGTITRGQEGTTGVSHASGDKVVQGVSVTDVAETWEEAVAALSGKVHRWKFEETSGATIADSISTLDLTLTGSAPTNYVRNISGPTGLGKATQFISARADSASIGSVPVGTADRTAIFVFRTSSQTRQFPFAYGTAAAYQLFYPALNDNGSALSLGHYSPSVGGGSDLLDMANMPISDGEWHMGALGLGGGNGKNRFGYIDGIYAQGTYTTAASTVSTGVFRLAQDLSGSFQFVGDLADLILLNRRASRAELDRLLRAAAL